MKKTIILVGYGQMGKAALPLINTLNWNVLGFADNDSAKWTPKCSFGPQCVMSVETAVSRNCDTMLLCPIKRERSEALKEQLLSLGYQGNICLLTDFYEALDFRSASIKKISKRLHEMEIPGAVAELGVYKGVLSALLSGLFPTRTLYLFDTFTGFDSRDTKKEQAQGFSRAMDGDFSDTSVEAVLGCLSHPDRAIVRKGFFPETAEGLEDERYAFVSLDADLYAPTLAGLSYFYPRLNPGGVIVLHDYENLRFQGVKKAVEDFEAANGFLSLVPLNDLHGSCMILKPFL